MRHFRNWALSLSPYSIIVIMLLPFLSFCFCGNSCEGEGGEDVSDLLYRRRCCVYINRSFCSQQEQKDDTISWVLCESCMDFPLSSFFFSASVFFLLLLLLFLLCFLMTNRTVCIWANGNESTDDAEDEMEAHGQ